MLQEYNSGGCLGSTRYYLVVVVVAVVVAVGEKEKEKVKEKENTQRLVVGPFDLQLLQWS